MSSWSAEELRRLDETDELEIAVRRPDGSLRRWTPIWMVRVDDDVYVRTWRRRDTGWFGAAVRSGRARIRLPGIETDVTVIDVGEGAPELRAAVDAAFPETYAHYGPGSTSQMVTDDAAAATLRLDREPPPVQPEVRT